MSNSSCKTTGRMNPDDLPDKEREVYADPVEGPRPTKIWVQLPALVSPEVIRDLGGWGTPENIYQQDTRGRTPELLGKTQGTAAVLTPETQGFLL